MDVRVSIGADRDGTIRAIDLYNLSNTGAYGDHGPTTAGLTDTRRFPCIQLTWRPSVMYLM